MGTMVTEIEFQQMMNALQVRGEIESLLGRLAAEEITDRHLRELTRIQKECAALTGRKKQKKNGTTGHGLSCSALSMPQKTPC